VSTRTLYDYYCYNTLIKMRLCMTLLFLLPSKYLPLFILFLLPPLKVQ